MADTRLTRIALNDEEWEAFRFAAHGRHLSTYLAELVRREIDRDLRKRLNSAKSTVQDALDALDHISELFDGLEATSLRLQRFIEAQELHDAAPPVKHDWERL
jgi:hypothetical protein